jgi:hypothetical protein
MVRSVCRPAVHPTPEFCFLQWTCTSGARKMFHKFPGHGCAICSASEPESPCNETKYFCIRPSNSLSDLQPPNGSFQRSQRSRCWLSRHSDRRSLHGAGQSIAWQPNRGRNYGPDRRISFIVQEIPGEALVENYLSYHPIKELLLRFTKRFASCTICPLLQRVVAVSRNLKAVQNLQQSRP